MIIDAHHHVWARSELPFSWMRGELAPLGSVDAGLDEYTGHAREAGVTGSVLVDAGAPAVAEQDARTLLALAQESAMVRGVVVVLPRTGLRDAELADHLGALRAGSGGRHLVGVRWTAVDAGNDWAAEPALADGLAVLADSGLALDVIVRTRELPALAVLAGRNDAVPIILDHLAKVPAVQGGEGELEQWRAGMRTLARRPNVFLKVSGLVHRELDADTLAQAVEWSLELFGPRRVMLGSDWPVCELGASFADTWRRSVQLVSGLSGYERAAVLGETARTAYRL